MATVCSLLTSPRRDSRWGYDHDVDDDGDYVDDDGDYVDDDGDYVDDDDDDGDDDDATATASPLLISSRNDPRLGSHAKCMMMMMDGVDDGDDEYDDDDANQGLFIGGWRRLLCRSNQAGQAGKSLHKRPIYSGSQQIKYFHSNQFLFTGG